MELCTARAISNIPQLHSYGTTVSSCHNQLRWRASLPPKSTLISFSKRGLLSLKYSSPRNAASDESLSSVTSQYVEEETDSTIASKGRVPSDEEENNQSTPSDESPRDEAVSVITMSDRSQPEDKEYGEVNQDEVPYEDAPSDVQKRIADILNRLNLKFDSEDSYSVALFGITAVVALWLATAVVGAIDSIPVLPKLLEVVGLGYTVWFSTRYLIFKRNRDELAAKIEELKQQVLGSSEE